MRKPGYYYKFFGSKSIFLIISFFIITCNNPAWSQKQAQTFRIADGEFQLNGKNFRIISGEMHCYRIPPEYWRDRMRAAKAMGLNCISTYIFWNAHEEIKGKFNFSGNADIARFISIAKEEGLWVILRPSPYACAEWEFGGYPSWLLNDSLIKIRKNNPGFLSAYKNYIQQLAKQLVPLQITHGGPVIMLQIENEYGSFGKDKAYMAQNRDIFKEAGFDVPFFTTDGPSQLPDGYLPGTYAAVDGLDEPAEVKKLLDKYNGGSGPYFISEWYPGWFDSWGTPHHKESLKQTSQVLENVLAAGYSINLYMFHGGTTRGFMNGANNPPFSPQTSSYDYDAPLDESGNVTEKYLKFRDIISKYLPVGTHLPPVPEKKKTISIPEVRLDETASLYDNLPEPVISSKPLSFEELGQAYGYVLYRKELKLPFSGYLKTGAIRDFAQIQVNGGSTGIFDRRMAADSMYIYCFLKNISATLEIFTENLGRINYGPYLADNYKGISGPLIFKGQPLTDWKIYCFPFDDPDHFHFVKNNDSPKGPVVRRGYFNLKETADTYLDMSKFGKGIVFLNGHNLGRYWYIGPSQTIYVPGPWLKKGKNEIEVFEMLKPSQDKITFVDKPILNVVRNPSITMSSQKDPEGKGVYVVLACQDTGAVIKYSVNPPKGFDIMHLSKTVYDKPFLVDKYSDIAAGTEISGISTGFSASFPVYPSLSTYKPINLKNHYSSKYPGGGEFALNDGLLGTTNFQDGHWQAFEKDDLEAVIDLGRDTLVNEIKLNFLQNPDSWIFLPLKVIFSISSDGKKYTELKSVDVPPGPLTGITGIKTVSAASLQSKGRYVKVHAVNTGICPEGHNAAGYKAWLFADEISVN
ncbi:MAG: beta-galactosidase [Bacteroidia bacterium]|nr:beta-galactosidase [Bacteroidia bacterium]